MDPEQMCEHVRIDVVPTLIVDATAHPSFLVKPADAGGEEVEWRGRGRGGGVAVLVAVVAWPWPKCLVSIRSGIAAGESLRTLVAIAANPTQRRHRRRSL